jgi:hypothetical protein
MQSNLFNLAENFQERAALSGAARWVSGNGGHADYWALPGSAVTSTLIKTIFPLVILVRVIR